MKNILDILFGILIFTAIVLKEIVFFAVPVAIVLLLYKLII